MTEDRIATIYVGLIREPRRFVVHRRNAAGRDTYEVFKPQTLREFVREILSVLYRTHPGFMARLAKRVDDQWMKRKHKTRHDVAEHREHVYINSAHLAEKNAEHFLGYWIDTNIGHKQALTLASLACEAAGVRRESIYGLRI